MSRPDWCAFFDANISFRLCRMIQALEEGMRTVVHATEHPGLQAGQNPWGNSTSDVAWIAILSADQANWVAISKDTRIIDTPHEREALEQADLTFLAFDGYFANADRYGQALQLVRMWPQIVQRADAGERGVFLVRPKQEEIRQILPGFNSKGRRM